VAATADGVGLLALGVGVVVGSGSVEAGVEVATSVTVVFVSVLGNSELIFEKKFLWK